MVWHESKFRVCRFIEWEDVCGFQIQRSPKKTNENYFRIKYVKYIVGAASSVVNNSSILELSIIILQIEPLKMQNLLNYETWTCFISNYT